MVNTASSHSITDWPPAFQNVERPRLFTHWRPTLDRKASYSAGVIGRPIRSSMDTDDRSGTSSPTSGRSDSVDTYYHVAHTGLAERHGTPYSSLFGSNPSTLFSDAECYTSASKSAGVDGGFMLDPNVHIISPRPVRSWGHVVIPAFNQAALVTAADIPYSAQVDEEDAEMTIQTVVVPDWDIIVYLRDIN
ncbi:hypothetical protein BV25DRAFT_1826123 [Artomyces pyxidatus]|uniref:Uncharacterized protein n=1 Tax=Artomyces pyxidatus TaxID=48021 RepID=A0ACB8T1F0_9AGAM|nr:hypothetical protein BV25DRAFT_1826123 [Artomyces pyxidatus]